MTPMERLKFLREQYGMSLTDAKSFDMIAKGVASRAERAEWERDQWKGQAFSLEKKLEAAVDALIDFGRHVGTCAVNPCDCAYGAALRSFDDEDKKRVRGDNT